MMDWFKKKYEIVDKAKPHRHRYTGSGIICDCPSETINIGFEDAPSKPLRRSWDELQ